MPITWTPEQLLKHIEEIALAQKLVPIIPKNEKFPLYILFKYPSKEITLRAEVEEDRIMRRAKEDKIITEVEMDKVMRDKRIWTEVDDEKVAEIREKITKWTLKTLDPDISGTSKEYAKELLAKLEEDIFKVEAKRERMLANTAERKARQAKYNFMAWACSYNPETSERYWENYLTFYEKVETELGDQLLAGFLKYLAGHTTEEIRYIARSSLWRLDYIVGQKSNLPLFSGSVAFLTPDQKNLIWWASYYQSIYEMMPDDQPDDWVIQDDESLDKYMEDLHKERSKERSSKRAEKYGGLSAEKMAERLIMRSHPDYFRREYDVVNPHAFDVEGQTDIRIDDDMVGKREDKLKRVIQRVKKFIPPPEEQG